MLSAALIALFAQEVHVSVPVSASDPPRDETHLAVGAGTHLSFGSSPATAVGVTASVNLERRHWAFGVEGRYDAPASAQTTQGARVRTSLAGVSLLPCYRARPLTACGVVLAARMSGDGSEDTSPSIHDASLFLGVGLRLVYDVRLPADFGLRIGGELLGVPIPYELALGDHRLFQSAPVAFSIGPSLVRSF